MPQLDYTTFLPQLVWLSIWFVILYVLMAKVGLPRIAVAIDARREQRDGDLASAVRMKAEAEAAAAAYQKTMAEARSEAQAIIKEATDRFAAEAAERQRVLSEALAQQIAAAETSIAATKEQALSEVRGIAIDVGRAVVEKLTGTAADDSRLSGAVDRVLGGQAQGQVQRQVH
ncbi:MAG TPA: F0F1 ATP synthase subunit B' [Stellaceae bacterium]|jgi:F-type H+-transporting ATPase subunit b|nr:F0F1 ATP synthase subunit B' [Stellaceae bacterium]